MGVKKRFLRVIVLVAATGFTAYSLVVIPAGLSDESNVSGLRAQAQTLPFVWIILIAGLVFAFFRHRKRNPPPTVKAETWYGYDRVRTALKKYDRSFGTTGMIRTGDELSKLEKEPNVLKLFVHALVDDADPGVRRQAATSLGRMGYTMAIEPLRNALADEEQSVRDAAAIALSTFGQSFQKS